MSFVDKIKEMYKDEIKEFTKFLILLEEDVEKGKTPEKELEKYEILEDPILPNKVRDILLCGFAYNYRYGSKSPVNPHPGLTSNVIEVDEKDKKYVNYDTLTTYLVKRFCTVGVGNNIFMYRNNMFTNNGSEYLMGKVVESILVSKGIADNKKIREIVGEIMARVTWRTYSDNFPFNYLGNEFIPLLNGVLWRGSEYRLLPHSPAFGYTYCLPIKYDPNAECPKIEKFLSEIVDEENIPILYEIPASCLLQSPQYHHAYMLSGEGSNGKSTYLTLIERFLGKSNISNVSLQELCNDRFKASQLVGKLANIYADIPKYPIKYTGKFKMLTGGDRMTVEKKYKDPFEFTNTARLIFSANELPEVSDQTFAFWRRWIVIEFPNKFPPNPDLIDELTTEEELSGFLNKVLFALTSIEIRGVRRTDVIERSMEMWMKKANSVYAFVKDCIETNVAGFEIKDVVYNSYINYCEENNLKAMPKNKFSMELHRFASASPGRRRIEGKLVYVYEGIKLKCAGEAGEEEKSEKSDVEIESLDEWDTWSDKDELEEELDEIALSGESESEDEDKKEKKEEKREEIGEGYIKIKIIVMPSVDPELGYLEIAGADGKTYKIEAEGQILTIPEINAKPLLDRGYAVRVFDKN